MSKKISRFTFLEKRKSRDFDMYDGPYKISQGIFMEFRFQIGM